MHIRPIPLKYLFFFPLQIYNLARYYFTSANAFEVKAKKDLILIQKSNKKWHTDSMQHILCTFPVKWEPTVFFKK